MRRRKFRRFSRALNGSLAKGDAYVTATLESLLCDRSSFARNLPPRRALYQFCLGVWSQPIRDDLVDGSEPSAFDRNLAALSPSVRQAFLLTTVEGFSQDEAAAIMGIDSARLLALLYRGARDLRTRLAHPDHRGRADRSHGHRGDRRGSRPPRGRWRAHRARRSPW